MLPELFLMCVGFFVLVASSRLVVDGFEGSVRGMSIGIKMIFASIVVALSTSLPELVIAIVAGSGGVPELSLGDLLGANLINVSAAIGLAAIIARGLPVVGEFVKWEMVAAFLTGAAPILLLFDGTLSRFDGAVLLIVYLIYFGDVVVGEGKKQIGRGMLSRNKFLFQVKRWDEGRFSFSQVKLATGIFLMFSSGALVVSMTERLVGVWMVNYSFLGLTLLAICTALPEIVLSLAAIRKKEVSLVFGSLLGSVITNSTLVAGILAVIRPVEVGVKPILAVGNIAFVLLFGMFWLFASTKKKVASWEGVTLVGLYLMAVGVLVFFR